ncbi:mesothelin-like protein [Coturnix japonica]|uniref:mesothelin-like protein n=1 Tax=Coturnix japonica TaxID=93934 RepID=UPI0007775FD8|nr:mesothelin-like protein [Coturnix japonica]XP_015732169.1 mesothelin-like protein [Coturnix japonica]
MEALSTRTPSTSSMVWAAPAPRFPVALMQAASAALLLSAVLAAMEPHADLGVLVCTMEPGTITASHPRILEHLKLCPMLTGAQRDAVNAVLLGGSTVYGHPSGWDLETLQRLGPLALTLNQTTLSLVDKAVREAFARSIAATYSTQGWVQREQTLALLTTIAAASQPRLKRNADHEMPASNAPSTPAGCKQGPITSRVLSDSLLLVDYDSPEKFYHCLSDSVLQTDLENVLELPLPGEYIWALKKRLQEVYPMGIPDAQLRKLRRLSRLYSPQEISQWQVTTADTLCALLNPSDGKWNSTQKQQLITRFLELGGNLTGPSLQLIGGTFLCNLNEEQIEKIPPEAIGSAGELNISSCSQSKKDQFYSKAKQAFASQAGTKMYYVQMRPYLGGAPAEDLKDLAEIGVDMDIDTFLALNPNELQKLSVLDVKNLLGTNLQQLKEAENETAVMCWVKKQFQQELDQILGIGLQGGIEEPPTTIPTTTPPPFTTATIPITTSSPKAPTPNAASPTFPHTTQPSSAVTTITSTTASSSITPCSTHQPTTSKSPASTLLTTILTAVSPNATSPSPAPSPAVTHSATTTSTDVPNPTGTIHSTGTPLVSPAPGGTTGPAPAPCNNTTPSSPCTLVPKPTSVPAATTTTTATEMSPPSHKPTIPLPNTTASTQSTSSSTIKTTTIICKTGTPPTSLSPSSTTSSTEITKKAPVDAPETPKPPPGGYINLKPEPGSGSRVSSCLLHILTIALGISLLQGLH